MENKVGRNNLCLCGSGRKFKKCCFNKKPRVKRLTMDMGKPEVINSVRMGPNGQIEFGSYGKTKTPIGAKLIESYYREKNPKILYDIPVDVNKLSINEGSVLNEYDYVYAIDTNAKDIGDKWVSVCYCLNYDKAKNEFYMLGPIFFENNRKVTEKTNWRELINLIFKDKEYNSNSKIAIVVDSDYGNISKYNSRELPIVDNFYLPDNFKLIYASTDSGVENLTNKLISECDKLGKQFLKEYEAKL